MCFGRLAKLAVKSYMFRCKPSLRQSSFDYLKAQDESRAGVEYPRMRDQ